VFSPEELNMSIGPVQNIGPINEGQSANGNRQAGRSQTTGGQHQEVARSAQPGTGTLPKQEEPSAKAPRPLTELPQDEVQVQRDSQIRDEVVIKYLVTATGSLILQVPSAEVLSVDRGIEQEFQQQAKARESEGTAAAAAAASAAKGEEPHGH
jgi:hypothetical protein